MIVNKPKIASQMLYNVKRCFAPHEVCVPISRLWKVNILTESDKQLQEMEFMVCKWTQLTAIVSVCQYFDMQTY